MKDHPLRTTVIGSYPFPGWLEFAAQNLDKFGPDDLAEMQDDAVSAAVLDQLAAGAGVHTPRGRKRAGFNPPVFRFRLGLLAVGLPPPRLRSPAAHPPG